MAGSSSTDFFRINPGDRVFISVLPYQGHSIGGAEVKVGNDGNADVTITVENTPMPTAQISVYVFHDKFPINNAADGVNEQGSEASCSGPEHFCPQEFTVQLIDAGGGYGVAGPGPVSTDTFGNPLGTTYTGNVNPDGSHEVLAIGSGIIHPDANGLVVVKNLAPGKYGVNVIPPSAQGWTQTSTIEGTKTIDAWVQAGNPAYVNEWGPTFYHINTGFVKEFADNSVLTGGATITGTIVNSHLTPPPLLQNAIGAPFPGCRIGLNTAAGVGIYSGRCDSSSHFTIPNVPNGTYQLVAWDDNLDLIISFYTVNVVGGVATVSQADANGNIPAPAWFHTSKHVVFNDVNANGFRDPGEVGLPNKTINLRFRDGRLYQTAPTDSSGEADFNEVFPFFHWQVVESDFARDKATGVTVVSDAGGTLPASSTGNFPDYGVLTPQAQICKAADALLTGCVQGEPLNNPNTGNNLSRTETGPVLVQAFQGFLGTTNAYEWGRKAYSGNENGGISGIVFYSSTRAEDDPRYGVGDPWEPGVARVQVALYADGDRNNIPLAGFPGAEDVNWNGNTTADPADGEIDDINNNGTVDRADVDNYPFGWADGGAMGLEDVDVTNDGAPGVFSKGDALQIVHTDAWDDNNPTACQGPGFSVDPLNGNVPVAKDCYDGLRNYNQARPGVFDGGYAFSDIVNPATQAIETIKPANYIVEASPPKGFEIVKEEDKNVTLGDTFEPNPLLLPPECVGTLHTVPQYISLHVGSDSNPVVSEPEETFYQGTSRPLCDLKKVDLKAKQNGVAEFHVFTKVPRSSRVAGNVFNDVLATIDLNSPNAGEKANPAWIPVSFRDHTGHEVVRAYTDEWGAFNAQLPSTWTANAPLPSGFSPMMLMACVNDSGIVPNPEYSPGVGNNLPFIQDPNYDPTLATVCWTFQYMPGSTTYLDTPTVSKGSFASTRNFPVDCEAPNSTPVIAKAEGVDGGPYVKVGTTRTAVQRTLTVTAAGSVPVPNPAYDGDGTPSKFITRNFGLGVVGASPNQAQARLTNATGVATTVNCATAPAAPSTTGFSCAWNSSNNTVKILFGTAFAPGTYDLLLHGQGGANGKWSPSGLKLTVGNIATPVPGGGVIHHVINGDKIQTAIDAAAPNDLILVSPGIYNEQLIMDKPLRLQGSGAPTTLIFAQRTDSNMIPDWRQRMQNSIDNGVVSLLPPLNGQVAIDFINDEMAGISVLGLNADAANGGFGNDATHPNARIDGFTITGADNGGGINVHGYADYLEISNNLIKANSGNAAGGIQIGRRGLVDPATTTYTDASNDNIRIHNNLITQNGALGTGIVASGGGIGLFKGANGYQIKENQICGNFSQGDGGGIGHDGLNLATALNSTNVIEKNRIIFNQSLYFLGADGGGISISGTTGLAAGLTEGSGSVVINANRIESNQAGSGDGGGISLSFINGQDVTTDVNNGYKVSISNNIVANNMAAFAGGGIALQDALQASIVNNTVVHNDSTATVPGAFGTNLNLSNSQPAGIVSRVHSPSLTALASVTSTFSNPLALVNNIVWHNRAFQWTADQDSNGTANDPGFVPNIGDGQAAVYDEFGVLPAGSGNLSPTYTTVSSLADDPGLNNNTAGNLFVSTNFNGNRSGAAGTSISTSKVFDEAGNASITVDFGPLTLGTRNYHLITTSNQAINNGRALGNIADVAIPGVNDVLSVDYDSLSRATGATNALTCTYGVNCPDRGADEQSNTNGTARVLP